jgi:G3E family GTPase
VKPGAPIPVNLVTGFLGVGKTTAIRHLLTQHPADERWAVLVNEFGDVGVDGQLLSDEAIVVEEVAGGCMCCVAAPLFTTGLNRLIRQHRPDRILIEPSGLGHPAQVLETLAGPLYAGVVEIRATLCLMDARHLDSPPHRSHPNFVDQIHLADVLVANKRDLYESQHLDAFEQFAADLKPPKTRVACVAEGVVDVAWLDLVRGDDRRAAFPEAHAFLVETEPTPTPEPDNPWLLIEGYADEYHQAGWRIAQRTPWSLQALKAWLEGLGYERKKGLCLTDRGWQAFNQSRWQAISTPSDGFARVEIIDRVRPDSARLDQQLRRFDEANPT